MTECNAEQLEFHALGTRAVVGKFDGGMISSDGGGLLLGEVESRTRIVARLAVCESLIWLTTAWVRKKWNLSSEQILCREIQALIAVAMVADAASSLLTGKGSASTNPVVCSPS